MLYYKVLKESDKCQTTNDHMKSLTAAKVREIQTLYCSGLDLERPLMLSLSPCSDKHKQEVITCINDFAKTFSSDFSESSLCRFVVSSLCLVPSGQETWQSQTVHNLLVAHFLQSLRCSRWYPEKCHRFFQSLLWRGQGSKGRANWSMCELHQATRSWELSTSNHKT